MAFSANQLARIAKAPVQQKAALKAEYTAQNKRQPLSAPPKGRAIVRATAPTRAAKQPRPTGPRGILNFLDPLCAQPAPSVLSDGKALPHTALVSGDFTVSAVAGESTILVATNTGDSGTVCEIFNLNATGKHVGGEQLFTIPTLAASDTSGGPSAMRAMKFSVSVVNCTNALKRGGRVTYLNSSQRLPPIGVPNSDNALAAVVTGIKSSPQRRRITGDLLGHSTQLIGYPVDSIEYGSFLPGRGTLTNAEFRRHVYGASAASAPDRRPMSVIAYVFDAVSDQQDYSVTIRASYYTRWPLTSVPGQHMKNMPSAPPGHINHVHTHAQNTAHELTNIVEGGALAHFGPKAFQAVRNATSTVASRMGASAAEALGMGASDIGVAAVEMMVPMLEAV